MLTSCATLTADVLFSGSQLPRPGMLMLAILGCIRLGLVDELEAGLVSV